MFILETYLTKTTGRIKEGIRKAWFWLAILAVEIILQVNTAVLVDSSSRLSILVTNLISLLTTFFLCFFLDTGILQKVIFSAIFQTAALISENICVTISSLLYSGTLTGYEYDISMNLMSKIILLIFTILLSFMKKDRPKPEPAARTRSPRCPHPICGHTASGARRRSGIFTRRTRASSWRA